MTCTECGCGGDCFSIAIIADLHRELAEKDRRAAIDSQIILDMSRQIAEREEEISRCWEEIRELQMTAWQRFKRWLKSEWKSDERIKIF
jgi:hypothetical protein